MPTTRQTGRRILVNTGALAGSSLWRIVISFLLQLVIARQLGVISMGQYTIALAYLHVCQIISELGLPALLVRDLAQNPQLRRSYFSIALRIQSVAALLAWGGLIVVSTLLPLSDATRIILWVIGASLPFYAVTSVCQMLFQSGERMEYVMGIELLINTLILLLSLLIIFMGGTTLMLVGLLVFTQLLSAGVSLFLLRQSRLLAGPQTSTTWQWHTLWQRSGPFFGLALADVMLQRADIVLLSIFGGEIITGIYSAAYNLLRVALKLVQNLWMALYPTLSRLYRHNPEQYRRLADFALHYGLLALLTTSAIGIGITPNVVIMLFGQEFVASAFVLQILLWVASFYLLENYAQMVLMIERRPLQSLLITGLHLLTLVILLPLFVTLEPGAKSAAWAVFIAGACGCASSIYLLYRWSLPGRLQRPWLVVGLTLVITLLGLYLPLAWGWRLLITTLLAVAFAWIGGLIDQRDWHLVRRVLQRESNPLPK